MRRSTVLAIGVVIGAIAPLLLDWVMFGTIQPCEKVGEYYNKIIMECRK